MDGCKESRGQRHDNWRGRKCLQAGAERVVSRLIKGRRAGHRKNSQSMRMLLPVVDDKVINNGLQLQQGIRKMFVKRRVRKHCSRGAGKRGS